MDPTFDCFDYQTVERPDARRCSDDTRRAQPSRWPNGMAESKFMRTSWQKNWMTRHKKITLGEMRASGVRGLLVYCADYKCSHWTKISGDGWPDDVRLSDLEPMFVCQACGQGAPM